MNPPVDIKPRPNHQQYIAVLRRMTEEQRLAKAFELSEMSKRLFIQGLRERFPDLDEEQFHQLMLKRLELCHNRNWQFTTNLIHPLVQRNRNGTE